MQYRKMESTGDDLSALGYGLMRLPQRGGAIDEEKAEKLVLQAVEKGINYFDTAWPYHNGKSEPFLGDVLAKHGLRERIKIATKLPPWLCRTRNDMDDILNRQLEFLKTDHIDYYLLHALDGASWKKMRDMGAADFLDTALKDGRIINPGFSFHGARKDFKAICDQYDWKFCQIQYNILDEYNQAGREGLDYAASKGFGIIIMEPLRGGILAGKLPVNIRRIYEKYDSSRSNADWALRWIWDHPAVTVVLSGMNHEDQIESNCRTADVALAGSLSQREKEILKQAGEVFQSSLRVGCTGCQYCLPCPAGVDIPRAFAFYNAHHMFRDKLTPWGMYLVQLGSRDGERSSLASNCINCGRCLQHCPQHINIPKELKRVEKRFEGVMGRLVAFLVRRMMTVRK